MRLSIIGALPAVVVLAMAGSGGARGRPVAAHRGSGATPSVAAAPGREMGPARDSLLAAPGGQGYGYGGYGGYGRMQAVVSYEKAEFAWSRLQYDPAAGSSGGYGFGYGYRGRFRGMWSQDYPKADRTFLEALKRLTRINARSYEQVVNLNNDDVYNFPFLYAVQVQSWTFTPAQAAKLRDYLLKGGFLVVDDFHGTEDWDNFMRGMRMVFPNRPVVDLPDNDEIFHVLYNLDDKFQVPGEQYVNTGRTYEKDGYVPKWRAIRDDNGRVMVAIWHNMHLGDAWEWADSPQYPEKFVGMAIRLGVNYVLYSMTH